MTAIYIDADACPVKDEIYRVAQRYGLQTFVVSNAFMRVPASALIQQIVVEAGADVADDWIAARAGKGDIVITADIPLASRALKNGAQVLAATGKSYTESSIGAALATREIMEHLRSMGETTGGPRAFTAKDRSAFLSALDAAVHRARKAN